MSQLTRVLIADSDINFSKPLKNFLNKQVDIKVVNIVRDGQGAVNTCREALPDLILMDLHLPVLDSIRAIKAILAQNDRIKILGLSAIPDDRYSVEAIKVGAVGCIQKNGETTYNKIVDAIRLAITGDVLLDSSLASFILEEFYRLAR